MDPQSIVVRPYVRALVRRKVRRLVLSGAFREQDVGDLEQDLLLHLLAALRRRDPNREVEDRFLATVVARAAVTLLRRRYAAKRRGDVGPLVADVEDARASRWRTEQLEELRIDVAEVLAALPQGLRHQLAMLQSMSVSEVARALGIRRTTLADQLKRLRPLLGKFSSK